jgi:hypothetical protein
MPFQVEVRGIVWLGPSLDNCGVALVVDYVMNLSVELGSTPSLTTLMIA